LSISLIPRVYQLTCTGNGNRAGVLGLTTALKLALEGNQSVTVVANHMPGDQHAEYTSIWAGVNWVP